MKQITFKFRMTKQSGFSLVETLIAMGISALILIISASIIFGSFKSTKNLTNQDTINNIHMNSVQLIGNNAKMDLVLSQISSCNIRKCLERTGTDCNLCADLPGGEIALGSEVINTITNEKIILEENFDLYGNSCDSVSKKCTLQKKIRFFADCSNTYCKKIKARAETRVLNTSEDSKLRDHVTEVNITARSKKQRGLIDFVCGTNPTPDLTFKSGIDFEALKVICKPLPEINISCSQSTPLKLIGDALADSEGCAVMIDETCSYGFSQLGALAGQRQCSVIVSSTPVPTPTPTPVSTPTPTPTIPSTPPPTPVCSSPNYLDAMGNCVTPVTPTPTPTSTITPTPTPTPPSLTCNGTIILGCNNITVNAQEGVIGSQSEMSTPDPETPQWVRFSATYTCQGGALVQLSHMFQDQLSDSPRSILGESYFSWCLGGL